MKPLRIGIVDPDTSHPGRFIPLIREMGVRIVGVYDGGSVHPPGYADRFARQHGISRVYPSLEGMAEDVDAVMIHSVNWDLHVGRARPFVKAGKAVWIDKPLAGSVRDLRMLERWEKEGVRLAGGSALRYCEEVTALREAIAADGDGIVYAMAGCSVDEFNYGIHAYSMLAGIYGPGISSVRTLGGSPQQQIEMSWKDGRRGIVSVGALAGYLPFYATVVTGRHVRHITAHIDRLYASLLQATLPYLAGETEAPVPASGWIEPELAAIAAHVSRLNGGCVVALDELADERTGLSGADFAFAYRRQKEEGK